MLRLCNLNILLYYGFSWFFFSKNKIADNIMESPMVIVVYYVMLYCIMCDNNDTYLGPSDKSRRGGPHNFRNENHFLYPDGHKIK